MTKTLVPLGLVVYLLAGRWNGNHPPAMVWMNDVMFGLIMSVPSRVLLSAARPLLYSLLL